MAARAYEFFNSELLADSSGLEIRIPETIRNVTKNEVPLWIETMGGHAVLKVPYSNAGLFCYFFLPSILHFLTDLFHCRSRRVHDHQQGRTRSVHGRASSL